MDEEAKRLIKIFGSKADLVVDEIRKVDQWDNGYFWEQVKTSIYRSSVDETVTDGFCNCLPFVCMSGDQKGKCRNEAL